MKNLSNLLQLTKQAASEEGGLDPNGVLIQEHPNGVRTQKHPNGAVTAIGPWWENNATLHPIERMRINSDKKLNTDIREMLGWKPENATLLTDVDPTKGLSTNSTIPDLDKLNKMEAPKGLFDTWSDHPTLDGIANIKHKTTGDAVLEYIANVKDILKKKDNPQPTMLLEDKGYGTKLWDWVKENPGLAGAGALGLTGLGYYLLKDDEDEEEED